jgi:hypothetical protein
MDKKRYHIEINYFNSNEEAEVVELETEDIEWSMDQYQRNREPLNWKIVKVEDL